MCKYVPYLIFTSHDTIISCRFQRENNIYKIDEMKLLFSISYITTEEIQRNWLVNLICGLILVQKEEHWWRRSYSCHGCCRKGSNSEDGECCQCASQKAGTTERSVHPSGASSGSIQTTAGTLHEVQGLWANICVKVTTVQLVNNTFVGFFFNFDIHIYYRFTAWFYTINHYLCVVQDDV